MSKRGLGKGLKALLADSLEEENSIIEVAVQAISPNPYQPRKVFAEESLEELAASIKEHGVIQPILVIEKEGSYFLVAGERRWRAVQKIGLKTIPAIVKSYNEKELMEIALIENLQREDLNPLDTALAYRRLLEDFSLTQEELGERVGKSRVAITNTLRILNLPPEIQEYVSRGTISAGHAKALLGLKLGVHQLELANKVILEGLSVRQTEELVKNWEKVFSTQPKKIQKKEKNLDIIEVEEKLKNFLGTKVEINYGRKKGKIQIEYYSTEDLERILECLIKE